MKIRDIIETDLEELSKLYYQFWGEESDVEKMKNQLQLIKNENNHIILVCENKGIIVGSVMGIVCRELYGDCSPFLVIENMIVDKQHRKQGIGTMLLEALERNARARNCTQMILVTEINRIDACIFYESLGFSKDTTGYKKKLQFCDKTSEIFRRRFYYSYSVH